MWCRWTARCFSVGIGLAILAATHEPACATELVFEPNLDFVQAAVRDIITKTEQRPEFKGASPLEQIEFLAVQQDRRLIPPPKSTGPRPPVYLVHAVAQRAWWKESRHYLIVFLPTAQGLKPLLIYRTESLEFRIVDLHDLKIFRHIPNVEAASVATLMIEGQSSHQYSEKRVSLWRYAPETGRFHAILGLVTEFTGSFCGPYEAFTSTVTFQRPPKGALPTQMDDVILTTDWYVNGFHDAKGNPVWTRNPRLDRRQSIFHWNGTKYAGKLDLPEQGKKTWATHQATFHPLNIAP